MTLLERARANRQKAVGSLASHKAENVFFIEQARQLKIERTIGIKFSTTRRTACADNAKERRVA